MTCEQHGCADAAVGAFLWPGHTLLASCKRHLEWAAKIADTMGFKLQVLPLAAREAELAEDAAKRLARG